MTNVYVVARSKDTFDKLVCNNFTGPLLEKEATGDFILGNMFRFIYVTSTLRLKGARGEYLIGLGSWERSDYNDIVDLLNSATQAGDLKEFHEQNHLVHF